MGGAGFGGQRVGGRIGSQQTRVKRQRARCVRGWCRQWQWGVQWRCRGLLRARVVPGGGPWRARSSAASRNWFTCSQTGISAVVGGRAGRANPEGPKAERGAGLLRGSAATCAGDGVSRGRPVAEAGRWRRRRNGRRFERQLGPGGEVPMALAAGWARERTALAHAERYRHERKVETGSRRALLRRGKCSPAPFRSLPRSAAWQWPVP